jgi:hypothetical protein
VENGKNKNKNTDRGKSAHLYQIIAHYSGFLAMSTKFLALESVAYLDPSFSIIFTHIIYNI